MLMYVEHSSTYRTSFYSIILTFYQLCLEVVNAANLLETAADVFLWLQSGCIKGLASHIRYLTFLKVSWMQQTRKPRALPSLNCPDIEKGPRSPDI